MKLVPGWNILDNFFFFFFFFLCIFKTCKVIWILMLSLCLVCSQKTRTRSVQNVRRHACSAMVKISRDHQDLMLVSLYLCVCLSVFVFDVLSEKKDSICTKRYETCMFCYGQNQQGPSGFHACKYLFVCVCVRVCQNNSHGCFYCLRYWICRL